MVSWPALGTRVALRYRRPPGSVPPLTDAVGHLLAVDPKVVVRTKTSAVVEVAPGDVVALRVLTDAPVRTADIRNLEHAVATARPAAEQTWLDGWLLRARGAETLPNSAVPLDISADISTIPAIVAWYGERGLTARLAIPDRLLSPPPGLVCERTEQVLVRNLDMQPARADMRASVTESPDGNRWLGTDPENLSEQLLAWGVGQGATRAYVCVPETDSTAAAESLGFRLHHRRRYLLALG